MKTIILKSELFDYLEKKYNELQSEFTINLAMIRGEGEEIDKAQTFEDFIEISKKLAEHHERLGYVLGKIELIKDMLQKF